MLETENRLNSFIHSRNVYYRLMMFQMSVIHQDSNTVNDPCPQGVYILV